MKLDRTLVTIVVQDLVIPEVIRLLHQLIPDEGSITIVLSKDSAQIKAEGQAFLDATKPTS